MGDLEPAGRGLVVAYGEAPIGVGVPSALSVKAETVPAFGPLWAFVT